MKTPTPTTHAPVCPECRAPLVTTGGRLVCVDRHCGAYDHDTQTEAENTADTTPTTAHRKKTA